MKKIYNLMALLLVWMMVPAVSAAGNPTGEPAEELVRPGGCDLINQWIGVQLKTFKNCKVPSHHTRQMAYIREYINQPGWSPMIVTPPHPEYPAAHAAVSMSAATALTRALGDKIPFTDDSYAYRGYNARHFNNFKEAGTEAGISRLYGGIHYRPSIEAGYGLGEKIGNNVADALDFRN